jgi:hypothetical protein
VYNPAEIGFFVIFGDYLYFKLTFLSITHFSMPFPVNIKPGSWSFVFFLSEIKYEISPKVTKNPEIDQATRFKLTTLFSAKLGQI